MKSELQLTFMRVKALLNWAIFCATCLATFKSVALQFHEQGVTLCNGTARLSKEDRGEDNKDPDWLIEQNIADKLLEGCYTVQR